MGSKIVRRIFVKNFILVCFVLSVLLSGCSNSFKLGNWNLTRGGSAISDTGNTQTAVVTNAVPIITIQRPEYQVDIYAFADGGEVHYVSVVIAGGSVSTNVSDRAKERIRSGSSDSSDRTSSSRN
jgi:major membrane immunogen (membrane-anchored lipoprotein)